MSSSDSKSVQDIPSLPKDISFAQTFLEWLVSAGGGGRSKSQGDQVLSRILKGQLQRFDEFSLFDRFRHVENGFDINFWKFIFVFLL